MPPIDRTSRLLAPPSHTLLLIFATVANLPNWRKPTKIGSMYTAAAWSAAANRSTSPPSSHSRGPRVYRVQKEGGTLDFIYPPSAAALLAPHARRRVPMAAALITLDSIAWAACVLLATYLVTGSAFTASPALSHPHPLHRPLRLGQLHLGQPNLVLLACMLGMFACLKRGMQWGPGALLALAAAIKHSHRRDRLSALAPPVDRRHLNPFIPFFLLFIFPAPSAAFAATSPT